MYRQIRVRRNTYMRRDEGNEEIEVSLIVYKFDSIYRRSYTYIPVCYDNVRFWQRQSSSPLTPYSSNRVILSISDLNTLAKVSIAPRTRLLYVNNGCNNDNKNKDKNNW